MCGSWGVGVVLYVGSHVQSFYRQVVTSWVSGLWRVSSGHLPSTCCRDCWTELRTQSAYGPLRVCGTAMHRCHCVCLCQRSLRDRRGSGSTSTRVSLRGLPSLAFCYVHFCSCASACSELLLVKPVQLAVSCCPQVLGSLLVCGSVCVPGGVGRIFCMHTSAHAGIIILSCLRGLVRHLF